MTKLDVVVPCYNYGRFLKACVRSILDQSVKDVRVLIIDDASSDDSLTVARELAATDSRVNVIAHPENRGHIRTYNEGIDWASADYFLLLSADDLLVPGAVERAVTLMDAQTDVVLVHGNYVLWVDDRPLPEIEQPASVTAVRQDFVRETCRLATNLVTTPTAIVRTSTQKAVGGYRATLPHAGDMEMWLRLAARGAVMYVDAVQAIYRKHASAMSNPYAADPLSDFRQRKLVFEAFFDEYGARLVDTDKLRAMADHRLAETAFGRGIRHLRRGQFRPALQFVAWAAQLNGRSRSASRVLALGLQAARRKMVSVRGESLP